MWEGTLSSKICRINLTDLDEVKCAPGTKTIFSSGFFNKLSSEYRSIMPQVSGFICPVV